MKNFNFFGESGPVTRVYYEAKHKLTEQEAQTVIQVMRTRLDAKGYTEATIVREGARGFSVEIPMVTDIDEEVFEILGTPAKISFVDPEGNVILDGKDIKKTEIEQMNNQVTGAAEYVVAIEFNKEGTKKFADATTKFVGQPIYIMLDEAIVSMPTVNEPITNGEAVISGDFTSRGAEELAMLINSGNLPCKLELISLEKSE